MQRPDFDLRPKAEHDLGPMLIEPRRVPAISGRGGPACAAFDGPKSRPALAKITYPNHFPPEQNALAEART